MWKKIYGNCYPVRCAALPGFFSAGLDYDFRFADHENDHDNDNRCADNDNDG